MRYIYICDVYIYNMFYIYIYVMYIYNIIYIYNMIHIYDIHVYMRCGEHKRRLL